MGQSLCNRECPPGSAIANGYCKGEAESQIQLDFSGNVLVTCRGKITGHKRCFHKTIWPWGTHLHVCLQSSSWNSFVVDRGTIPAPELVRFIWVKLLHSNHFDVNDVCRAAASSLWFNHISFGSGPFWLQLGTSAPSAAIASPPQSHAPACQAANRCFLVENPVPSFFFFLFLFYTLWSFGPEFYDDPNQKWDFVFKISLPSSLRLWDLLLGLFISCHFRRHAVISWLIASAENLWNCKC